MKAGGRKVGNTVSIPFILLHLCPIPAANYRTAGRRLLEHSREGMLQS